ncbi:Sialic acid-binding Ig-like lectin 12 [Tupaia chinensis]|uniref:Sialic acid-binding Ig-like lectin 12 n=1 Tax=Tupaia chinensis TaxID=246437 RepID=L9L2I5_TUPCH|nr:Sialic acid-binding Ig-like lectin 12 [Tupaia chinensis]
MSMLGYELVCYEAQGPPLETEMWPLLLLLLLPLLREESAWRLGWVDLLFSWSLAHGGTLKLRVPETVTVPEGLCILVSCSFYYDRRANSYYPLPYGYWFREGADTIWDTPVATNDQTRAVQKDTQGRFHLLGDPENYNCSLNISDARREDSGSYIFHVERGSAKWTSTNKFVLHVMGSLAQDDRFWLDVPESVTVQEGLCVTVPCSFSSSWGISSNLLPAYGYWFRAGADINRDTPVATNNQNRAVQKDTQGRFQVLGDPTVLNCSLSIRDARKSDSGSYVFRVERGYTKWTSTNKFFLHVTALTLTPDIHIPATLESSRPSNLTCSVPWACEQGTPPTFSWPSAAPTSLGPTTTHSSVLTLTPRPQDHGTNLTCQVRLPGAGVTTERTLWLSMSWTSGPMAEVLLVALGEAAVKVLLLCLLLIFLRVKSHRKEVCVGPAKPAVDVEIAQSSGLTLTPVPQDLGTKGTCQVKLPGAGVTRTQLCSSVNPASASPDIWVPTGDQGTSRGTGVALGAVGGAGVTALLAVGLCLIFFIVKTHRKKAAGRAVGVSDSHPADGPACLGHQQEYKLHGLSEPPSSSEASPTLDMEQELHYASLSFHGMTPQEGTSTEYSEIRTQQTDRQTSAHLSHLIAKAQGFQQALLATPPQVLTYAWSSSCIHTQTSNWGMDRAL